MKLFIQIPVFFVLFTNFVFSADTLYKLNTIDKKEILSFITDQIENKIIHQEFIKNNFLAILQNTSFSHRVELIKILIENKIIDQNFIQNNLQSILQYIYVDYTIPFINLLIENKIIDKSLTQDNLIIILETIESCNILESIRLLIENKIIHQEFIKNNFLAILQKTSYRHRVELIKILIENKIINQNFIQNNLKKILKKLFYDDKMKFIKLLIEKNIKNLIKDKLIIILQNIEFNNQIELIKLLIEKQILEKEFIENIFNYFENENFVELENLFLIKEEFRLFIVALLINYLKNYSNSKDTENQEKSILKKKKQQKEMYIKHYQAKNLLKTYQENQKGIQQFLIVIHKLQLEIKGLEETINNPENNELPPGTYGEFKGKNNDLTNNIEELKQKLPIYDTSKNNLLKKIYPNKIEIEENLQKKYCNECAIDCIDDQQNKIIKVYILKYQTVKYCKDYLQYLKHLQNRLEKNIEYLKKNQGAKKKEICSFIETVLQILYNNKNNLIIIKKIINLSVKKLNYLPQQSILCINFPLIEKLKTQEIKVNFNQLINQNHEENLLSLQKQLSEKKNNENFELNNFNTKVISSFSKNPFSFEQYKQYKLLTLKRAPTEDELQIINDFKKEYTIFLLEEEEGVLPHLYNTITEIRDTIRSLEQQIEDINKGNFFINRRIANFKNMLLFKRFWTGRNDEKLNNFLIQELLSCQLCNAIDNIFLNYCGHTLCKKCFKNSAIEKCSICQSQIIKNQLIKLLSLIPFENQQQNKPEPVQIKKTFSIISNNKIYWNTGAYQNNPLSLFNPNCPFVKLHQKKISFISFIFNNL